MWLATVDKTDPVLLEFAERVEAIVQRGLQPRHAAVVLLKAVADEK